MNLLLLNPDAITTDGRARVSGRQLQHLKAIRGIQIGDQITAGIENHLMGVGTVLALSEEHAILDLHLNTPPPAALPLTLMVALPRPKMIKRIVQTCATMGVKQLIFLNSFKVEKSYWQSPWLSDDKLREQAVLGLEQAVDTVIPEIRLERLFKPFVEDQLPKLALGKRALVAHPGNHTPCPGPDNEATLLCIGPEGGFIDYEVEKLQMAGCTPIHMGTRILRTETAVPALISRLFPIA